MTPFATRTLVSVESKTRAPVIGMDVSFIGTPL